MNKISNYYVDLNVVCNEFTEIVVKRTDGIGFGESVLSEPGFLRGAFFYKNSLQTASYFIKFISRIKREKLGSFIP